jgi:HNH endonuclease/AP2 domain
MPQEPSYCLIQVGNELLTKVDPEDFGFLSHWKWRIITAHGYVCRPINWRGGGKNNQSTIYMHRLIMGLEKGDGREIDHINHDKLDNRRENLRIVNRTQNLMNRRSCAKSGYKGVVKHCNRWLVYMGGGGGEKSTYLGSFPTPEEAAHAYDAAVRRIHGEFAWLNFPDR